METCLKTGAYIHLVDYGLYAPADLFAVGDKRVVRFNGNLEVFGVFAPDRAVTHELYLSRQENYWRKDLGIAVVAFGDLVQM